MDWEWIGTIPGKIVLGVLLFYCLWLLWLLLGDRAKRTTGRSWKAYRSDSDYPEPEWYVEGPEDRTYGPFDEDEALGVRDSLNRVHHKRGPQWNTD